MKTQVTRARLWADIPDYLRLDPARAFTVYLGAQNNPLQRAEQAARLYLHGNKPGVCMYATNHLMRYWHYEFWERCKLPVKPGYANVCAKHLKVAHPTHLARLERSEASQIVRGETDPDVIEREWAALEDRRIQQEVERRNLPKS